MSGREAAQGTWSQRHTQFLAEMTHDISGWLNQSQALLHPVEHLLASADPATISNYFSYVSRTATFTMDMERYLISHDEEHIWTVIEQMYGSFLFEQSKWRAIYNDWKIRLNLHRLPHFDVRGKPDTRTSAVESLEYLLRTMGSTDFPDLQMLYRFSLLFMEVARVRGDEIPYQTTKYCPCSALTMVDLVSSFDQDPFMDTTERVEWVSNMAAYVARNKKCFVHETYPRIKHIFYDDNDVYDLKRMAIDKPRMRQRSKSCTPTFHKPYDGIDFDGLQETVTVQQQVLQSALERAGEL